MGARVHSRTSTVLERAIGPKRNPSEIVWVKCPHPLIRAGLEAALEGEKEVRRVEDVESSVTLHSAQPGCIVVCAPQDDLPQEISRLRNLAPDATVVVMGLFSDASLARTALRSGARGFIHIGMEPSQVRRAILVASRGELVVPRELITELIGQEDSVDIPALTPRQREILHLVTEGFTNAQIAQELFLSEYTIKQHLRAAYKLLGVRNRTEAARLYKTFQDR